MPAPTRPAPVRTEPTALAVPKGIVGYYTDLEVDELLAALPAGGGLQTVDLSAYATTAYVDGIAATVYTKAEVDAAIAAAATGDVDLSAYATTTQLTDATDEIKAMATAAFQERYTKQEVDGLFVRKEDSIAPPNLDGYATEQYVDEAVGKVAADVAGLTSNLGQYLTQPDLDLVTSQVQALATVTQDAMTGLEAKADKTSLSSLGTTLMNSIIEVKDGSYSKDETYTKLEVDAAIAGIVAGDLTQEQIDAILSQVGPVDLTAYAKSEDVYTKVDGDARYGSKVALDLLRDQTQIIFNSIYTREESDGRYAKKSDNTQNILAKVVTAQGYGFGEAGEPPVALTYTDTGEGYGPRLVLAEGMQNEYLVYKSDLDDLLTGSSTVDTSNLATTATVSALEVRVKTIEDKPAPYTKNEVDQRIATCVTVGSWVNAASGANWAAGSALSSRKLGTDIIQIDCSVTFATALAANTWQDLGVLATAARPAKDTNLTAVAMDGSGVPQIVSVWAYATGRVAIRNYGAITSVRFNGIISPR